MISVKELIKESRFSGNYFASDAYIQGDLESGLIENRDGGRLLALPESFMRAIYEGFAPPSSAFVQHSFRSTSNLFG